MGVSLWEVQCDTPPLDEVFGKTVILLGNLLPFFGGGGVLLGVRPFLVV